MTTKNVHEAKKIASALVKNKLAACINITPKIESVYRWQGKICKDNEALCIIKTTKHNFKALKTKIKSMHSYSIPEIVGLPINIGSEKYLEWLFNATNG